MVWPSRSCSAFPPGSAASSAASYCCCEPLARSAEPSTGLCEHSPSRASALGITIALRAEHLDPRWRYEPLAGPSFRRSRRQPRRPARLDAPARGLMIDRLIPVLCFAPPAGHDSPCRPGHRLRAHSLQTARQRAGAEPQLGRDAPRGSRDHRRPDRAIEPEGTAGAADAASFDTVTIAVRR